MNQTTEKFDSIPPRMQSRGYSLKAVLLREFDGLRKGLPVVIPPYQRAYCWQVEDIQKVFDDIDALRFKDDAYEPTRYYLGAIAFQSKLADPEIPDDQSHDKLLLLDGQQRLTSLILWIYALKTTIEKHGADLVLDHYQSLKALEGIDLSLSFTYQQPQSYRHMVKIYQALLATYDALSEQDEELKRELQIEAKLWETQVKEDLKRLAYMLDYVLFAVTIFNTQYEATQYFMGENHRGVPMSLVDKVKSYHLRFVPEKDAEREKVMKAWQWVWKSRLSDDVSTDANADGVVLTDYILPMLLFMMDRLPDEPNKWQHPDRFEFFKGFHASKQKDRWLDRKARVFERTTYASDSDPSIATLNRRSLDLGSELMPGTPFFVRIVYATVLLKAVYGAVHLKRDIWSHPLTYEKLLRQVIFFALVFWADCYLKTQTDERPLEGSPATKVTDVEQVLKQLAEVDQEWNEERFNLAVTRVQNVLRTDLAFCRYQLFWKKAAMALVKERDRIGPGTILYWVRMHEKVRSALVIPYRHGDPSRAYQALMQYFASSSEV